MPIHQYDGFLSEDLYVETIQTARHLLTLGNNLFATNQWWNTHIVKDSAPVFVHNVNRESELNANLRKTIEQKCQSKVPGNYGIGNVMIYYWTRYSYIPWHTDKDYFGAITVYLNEEWQEDFGGYFLYRDKKDIKAIIPKRNSAVLQYGGVNHCTTAVNFDGNMRITIQAFLHKNKE